MSRSTETSLPKERLWPKRLGIASSVLGLTAMVGLAIQTGNSQEERIHRYREEIAQDFEGQEFRYGDPRQPIKTRVDDREYSPLPTRSRDGAVFASQHPGTVEVEPDSCRFILPESDGGPLEVALVGDGKAVMDYSQGPVVAAVCNELGSSAVTVAVQSVEANDDSSTSPTQ